jgi:hypothetical protein
MAAALTGVRLYDNYAFHGALERFAPLDIGEIKDADGIPDAALKAESFKFGQACGKVLEAELRGYSPEELLLYEAAAAKAVFINGNPQPADKENIKTVFRALLKYAQIQTHTAKPGGEDINAWLAGYYRLLTGYEPTLDALAELITSQDAELKERMNAFINKLIPKLHAVIQPCDA